MISTVDNTKNLPEYKRHSETNGIVADGNEFDWKITCTRLGKYHIERFYRIEEQKARKVHEN